MAIAKGRPASGFRVELDRVSEAPLLYRGKVETPESEHPITVEGTDASVVGVDPDLAERVRILVRSVLRHASADGRPAPPRIARWRPGT